MLSKLPKFTQLECPSKDRETRVLHLLPWKTKLMLLTEQGEKLHNWAQVTGTLWDPRSITLKANSFFQCNIKNKNKTMCRMRLHFYITFHISKPFWNLESTSSLLTTLGEGCADTDVSVFPVGKHMSRNITHLFQGNTGRQWQGCSCNLALWAGQCPEPHCSPMYGTARLPAITEADSTCSFVLLLVINYFQTQCIFSERNYSSRVQ